MNQHAPVGLVLAAGRGKRLGGLKQLLVVRTERGELPLVAAAFDSIAPWCERMVVVLGHETDKVKGGLSPRKFAEVRSDPDAPMFASARAGLEKCRELAEIAPVLMLPADEPFVSGRTVAAVVAAGENLGSGLGQKEPGQSQAAVAPRNGARGGHPLWIPPAVRDVILQYSGEGGLRGLWNMRPELRRHVDVHDPGVGLDLDTPEDLERSRGR